MKIAKVNTFRYIHKRTNTSTIVAS